MPSDDPNSQNLLDAFAAADIAACLTDAAGVVVGANEPFGAVMGVAPETLSGVAIADTLDASATRCHEVGIGQVYRFSARERHPLRFMKVIVKKVAEGRLVRLEDVTREMSLVGKLGEVIDVNEELLRQADFGVWRFDPDSGVVEINEIARARQGRTTAKTSLDVALRNVHPDDRALEANAREYVCRTGGTATTTLRIAKLDGGWNVVRVHSVAGRKTASGLYVVHTMSEDVSTFVNTRDEAARNAKRLELALRGSGAAAFELDLKTGVRWESPFFRELVGDERMERAKDDPLLVYHPEDEKKLRRLASRPRSPTDFLRIEVRLFPTGDEERWVRLAAQFDADPDGSLNRVIGLIQDVTARKRQEIALVEAERAAVSAQERLQLALDAALAGVFEADLATGEIWASPELQKLAGEPALKQMRAGIPFGFYHPEERERLAELWERRLNSEAIRGTDTRLYREDGEDFWVRVFTQIEMGHDGKPVRVVALVQDINERKRQEFELVKAMQAAEAATLAKSSFLASMSHEIRTPLNGVLGMAQVLEMGELNEDQREHVATIMDCGKSLMSLLNDVLDISKMEAGKLEVHAVDGDLLETVQRVRQLFEPKAREAGLYLNLDVGRAPPHLSFDPVRVRQCLSNLLSNAIKFTSEGGVTLRVDTEVLDDGRYEISLSVRDTGIGIDPSVMSRLFEPFTQADESTTRRFGGTGLGLSIARDVARLMGGDITVQSKPNEGSTFCLTFVCEAAADALDASDWEISGAVPAAISMLEDEAQEPALRVLLVDDNAINRKVAGVFLRAIDAAVVEAENGVEALAKLGASSFDLVLLDVHMPVMDGKETIRRIRQSDQVWRDVPVIALTAHAMEGDREKFMRFGMDDYISKPIDQHDFTTKVRTVLADAASGTLSRTRETV